MNDKKNSPQGGEPSILIVTSLYRFIVFFFSLSLSLFASDAVTYEFTGGRLGDNLLSYLHAKWISHTRQIPLLYKPFPYSSELCLHDIEIPYTLDSSLDLYVCPYFP